VPADPPRRRQPRVAYDTGAEKALASVKEHSWTVVSMHNDFKVVSDP
jgi:hypothetical protein